MQCPPIRAKSIFNYSIWLLLILISPCFAQTGKVAELQNKLKQAKTDTGRMVLLKQLADAYGSVDPAKKFYYANLFKQQAEKLNNNQAIADAYIQMGAYYAFGTKQDSALYYFQLSYNYAAKSKYTLGMGKALTDLGLIYALLDETKDAIRCDFQALGYLKKANNLRGINQLYTNIGSIYFDLKQYKLAETYFNQCLVSYTASKDSAGIGYALFTLGNCLQQLKEDEKAKDYFTRSLAIREKLGDVNGVALVKRGLANVYFHQQQYTLSINYLDTALKSVRDLKYKYEEAAILIDVSEVYQGMKEYDKSVNAAKQSLSICHEIKSTTGINESLQRLIDAYKAKGDLTNAFNYQSQYIKNQDGERVAKSLKDVTLTEFGRIRAENADLEKSNQLIANKNTDYLAKLNQYSNVIVVIVVVLGLVVLFLFVLYARNLEKQATNKLLLKQKEEIAKINQELELLNEEVTAQMELTNTQNHELEQLNSVKNKLFSIVSHDLRSPLGTLQSLLRIYLDGEIDEEELGELLFKLEDTVLATRTFLDNLLEWSKSQLEGMVAQPEKFDVTECIKENIQLFASQSSLKGLNIINKTKGPVLVYADPNMISLVIRNLLSNSIKFCTKGDAITFDATTKKDKVLISISDTGPGISEADREKLFSIEHTVSFGTQGEKGNRLGLILCKDVITQNKGTISFETDPNNGTTFWVELPAAEL